MRVSPPLLDRLFSAWFRGFNRYMPPGDDLDSETLRLAHLLIGFSWTGSLFASIYALFYLIIGHYQGAACILTASLLFMQLPFWIRRGGRLTVVGGFFTLVLLALFTVLSLIEGGVRGHAVAWLAMLPVCALLLTGGHVQGFIWSGATVLVTTLFGVLEWAGVTLPYRYPYAWHGPVTAIGFAGLALFMLALGWISETSRQDANQARDEALEDLRQANERLRQLDREKNEFLGIAAHDLKNPLSVVQGYAELIEMTGGENAEETVEAAQEIGEATRRMRDIVQDVLDVNAIESGHYPLKPSLVNLTDLASSCLAIHQRDSERKDLRWETTLPAQDVWGDPNALTQVLDNLLSNAVKYTPPGGQVKVRIDGISPHAVFEVWNEGPGLSAEDLGQVFLRFARLSTRPTAGESSTGLGLSIARKITEAMHGDITCESQPGQGATFRVRLPAQEPG